LNMSLKVSVFFSFLSTSGQNAFFSFPLPLATSHRRPAKLRAKSNNPVNVLWEGSARNLQC
jgi:hypothetical protein